MSADRPSRTRAPGDGSKPFEVDAVRDRPQLEPAEFLTPQAFAEPVTRADDPQVAATAQVLEPFPKALATVRVGRQLPPRPGQERAAQTRGISRAVPASDRHGADRTRVVDGKARRVPPRHPDQETVGKLAVERVTVDHIRAERGQFGADPVGRGAPLAREIDHLVPGRQLPLEIAGTPRRTRIPVLVNDRDLHG
jgi:hypothetical protein